MKKNLKIVSAAAAALLAVAPIATMAVPANAGVTYGNTGSNTPSTSQNQIAVNVALGNIHNKTVHDILTSNDFKITASLKGTNLTVPALTNVADQVKFYPVTSTGSLGTALTGDQKLDATAGDYVISISGLHINGLTTGTSYVASEGNFGDGSSVLGTAANTKNPHEAAYFGGTGATGATFSERFTVNNPSLTGTPYFYTQASAAGSPKVVQTTGNVSVTPASGKVSLNDVASAIHSTYKVDVSNSGSGTPATVSLSQDQIANQVKAALQAAGITLDSSNQFNTPANSFTVNVKATASNGKTVTLPVTVGFKASNDRATNPNITIGGQTFAGTASSNVYTPTDSDSWAKVAVNGNVDTNAIKGAFTAKANSDGNAPTLNVNVDTSKVNTKVAGKYPVTVSATNPEGKTSKVTFMLTVGDPDAKYQDVTQDGTIYSLNGNKVSSTSNSVKTGDKVATYGTVKVGDTTYVRINGKDSNTFVEQKVFNKAPESNKHVRVWNKKESYIYNEHHVRQGNGLRYKIGSGHNVVANEDGTPKVYHVGGIDAYKLSDGYFKGHYVDVRNFTTKRANNNHKKAVIRSRVFDVRGKVVKHMYINKGATIKVYGTKKIKGHKMYKIAKHNRYVKVANFR